MVTQFMKNIAMGSKDDTITLHLDTMGFTVKPGENQKDKKNTVPGLFSRASRNIVTITKEELVNKILHGYSIIPGVCPMSEERKNQEGGGSKQEDFVEQQIWALDFDSAIDKGSKESHMDEIIERLKELGICPFFVYSSFSDGKLIVDRNVEKFRVVFATKDVVTDIELRDKLHATLMGLFCEQIDKSCKNRNRYYNGTRPDARVYLDYEAVIDANAVVENYWDDKYRKFFPGEAKSTKKANSSPKEVSYNDTPKKERSNSLYELMPVEKFPDIFPKVHNGLIKYDMQQHCEEFFSLIDVKNWVEGEKRRNYVFGAFNMAAFTYGTREAYARCIDLNNQFEEPLSDKEFFNNIKSAFEHIESNCAFIHDTQYVFRYDTLLESIEIPEEVKAGMNYFKNKREKEHADLFRPLKRERDAFICELRNEGMGAKKIRKELIKKYGVGSELILSLEGVKWFLKHRIKKGGSFGTTTLYNYYSSLNNNQSSSSYNDSVLAEEAEFDHTEDLELSSENSHPALNEGQERAFNDALEGYNIVVSSNGGGTGKSFLIDRTSAGLEAQGKVVAVCAPTAVAANNVGGVTVHSAFMMSTKDNEITNRMLYAVKNFDTVIIDEAAMLGAEDFRFICKVIEEVREQFDKVIQVVLVCDVLQLPPVEDAYFFQTDYYRSYGFRIHYLTENIRQQGDKLYLNLLNKVRIGEDKIGTAKELNRILQHNEDIHSIYLVAYKDDAARINRQCLKRIPGDVINLGNVKVKIGAKVMCTKNNSRAGYYNGMRGVVESVGKNCVMVRTDKGTLVTVRKQTIVTDKRTYQGYPLALGYAVTIHKAQGMTLDSANIDPRAFADGQLYVALSRVKTASGVHLLYDIEPDFIMVNEDALKFDEELRMQCGIETVVEEVEYDNERE